MKKKSSAVVLIVVFGITVCLGCQKSSETSEETTNATRSSLMGSMDEYHRVLRPLMHQALPEQDVAAFKERASELLKCAEKLVGVPIPAQFVERKATIDSLAQEILAKTKTFHEICQTGTADEIFDAFMVAHDDYEALADIVYKL